MDWRWLAPHQHQPSPEERDKRVKLDVRAINLITETGALGESLSIQGKGGAGNSICPGAANLTGLGRSQPRRPQGPRWVCQPSTGCGGH
jgi:hypothetical protein